MLEKFIAVVIAIVLIGVNVAWVGFVAYVFYLIATR